MWKSKSKTKVGEVISNANNEEIESQEDPVALLLKQVAKLQDEIDVFLMDKVDDWLFEATDGMTHYLTQIVDKSQALDVETLTDMVEGVREGFEKLQQKFSGSDGKMEVNANPEEKIGKNSPDEEEGETTINIAKLAKKLRLTGNSRPLKRSTATMIAEAARIIRGLKQDLLNEGKVVQAQETFHHYYNAVKHYVRAARRAAGDGDEAAIKESWTFERGGLVRGIEEADLLLQTEACNEEVAKIFEDFLKNNEFQYF